MRPAIEVWHSAFCAWMPTGRRKASAEAAAAIIEADRAALVREIVGWVRTDAMREWGADPTGRYETQFIADAIEAKWLNPETEKGRP